MPTLSSKTSKTSFKHSRCTTVKYRAPTLTPILESGTDYDNDGEYYANIALL